MKYFSLLYGDQVHPAPGAKIVPESEFSLLVDGKELLEKIHEEDARFKEEATKHAAEQKETAKQEGFNEGLEQWATQLASFEKTLQKSKEDLEKLIVPIAIKAAQKIVAREMEIHPDVLVDIVKQSLKAVSQHHRFTIYVNKQDFATIDANRPKLKEGLESVESLTIKVRDDIKPQDAIIETEAGIINVQLEQLWKSLETAFQTLMRGS